MARYKATEVWQVLNRLHDGLTVAKTSRQTGVSQRTIRRWRDERAAEDARHREFMASLAKDHSRRQEADSVRLGTVVSVVLIVGAVLVGVWVAMKGGW